MTTPTKRCFVAIPVPKEIGDRLAYMQSAVGQQLPGKIAEQWSLETAGFHITLRFLGNLTGQEIDRFDLAHVARANRGPSGWFAPKPFDVRIGPLDMFRAVNGTPQVLYARITGDLDALEALNALQLEVERGALDLGLPPPQCDFTPHVTLGRFTLGGFTWEEIGAVDESLKKPEVTAVALPASLTWTVTGCALMESVRTQGGIEYRTVSEARFL